MIPLRNVSKLHCLLFSLLFTVLITATLRVSRDKADNILDYPAMWKEPPPPRVRVYRKRKRVWVGPLENDRFWWKDPVKKIKHRELTKAGMERARQAGQQIGVIPVEERDGFAERFTPVLAQLERKAITRKQATRALGISGPTLKRILDGHPTPTRQKPVAVGEKAALVV